MTRRDALTVAAGAALLPQAAKPATSAGRVKQSVARWCYGRIPIEDLCRAAADLGVTGMDLVAPKDWPVCRKYGITPAMVQGAGGFGRSPSGSGFGPATGWNHKENHDALEKAARENIERAAKAGVPNIISLFGNRNGLSDEEGIANCIAGLNRVKKYAEDQGVTIAIELLNSKVDHKDYQGDHTAFGVAVVKGVDSPRVKLLYDAYHMQIMEGDLIRTIRENIQYIAHFHVAGVPGRHEIDDTQEVNWHAVANAIADLNFQGYIAQEFVPARDPLTSLRQAVKTLTV
ncbi:MAG TPA: TIM barrel protein [Bryobacteraceae bacterium]|nr:TIM barrel protein [Bryobacteraceae bacterium]